MKGNYDTCYAYALEHEGGYCWDKGDPGGPTKYGVTIYDLGNWRGVKVTSKNFDEMHQEVKNLSLAEAKLIFKKHYWDPLRCDELPAGLDYTMFDFGVNSGNKRAIIMAQRSLQIADDGVMGPVTWGKMMSADPVRLMTDINARRQRFLEGLSTFRIFGRGWTKRVKDVQRRSVAMYQVSGRPKVEEPAKIEPVSETQTPPSTPAGDSNAWWNWRRWVSK